MQIQITLDNPNGIILPNNYEYQLQSAIYAKLQEIGASDFWHEEGFGTERKFKTFIFSPLKGEYIVANKKLVFSGDIGFELRSLSFDFCDEFQRAIEKHPYIRLFDSVLPVTGASLSNYHVHGSAVSAYALSPVVAYGTDENHKTIYHSPDDDIFTIKLLENYKRKYEAFYGGTAPELSIIPQDQHKKVVMQYKGFWITGYKGRYLIRGDYRGLELLYNTGLGSKNSQGFGYINYRSVREHI